MTIIDYTMLVIGGIFAYLIGSIPSSVWIGRSFYGIDVREKGSKNAGATNTIRTLGLLPGLFVLGIDAFKGWFAVYIGNFFGRFYTDLWGSVSGAEYLTYYKLILGIIAVIGHALPIYVGFKGGKGVATMLGVVIGLFDHLLPLILAIFVVTFVLSKYISLASIVTSIAFPILYSTCGRLLNYNMYVPLLIFTILVAIFIPYTHRKNIKRLINHTEPKFRFKKTVDE
ncbi:MAG: glycerol-3-phosphate 1-O-acyltransferase PlsY [Bacteroidales bacterium]|jgi:glycerol-3-phosphate acyltransferase PlsY|nr:glycerol-3-phosphate 1-O-acyltransferase PlsY [Bacteroidales bacterium]